MKKIYLDDNLTEKINSIIEQDVTAKYQYIQFQTTDMKFPKEMGFEKYYFIMGTSHNGVGIILVLIPNTHPKLNNTKNKYDGFELLKNYTLHVEGVCMSLIRYYVVDDTEVLDNSEKEYLSFVFKPFAKRILSVTKVQNSNNGYQKLVIAFYDKTKMIMPRFEYNTMYRGMELNVAYTLEELGLSQEEKPKNEYKITLTEFFNSTKDLCIHCNTEEKANELLKAFDKLGKKWATGNSYLEFNNWDSFKEKTCYLNDGFYTKNGYCNVTYEFEEVDLNK